MFTQPPDQEGSQDSGDSDYRDEEQERVGGRSPARERGRKRELARPLREDFQDKDSTVCNTCGIAFDERLDFLDHYLLVRSKRKQTKDSGKKSIPVIREEVYITQGLQSKKSVAGAGGAR